MFILFPLHGPAFDPSLQYYVKDIILETRASKRAPHRESLKEAKIPWKTNSESVK